MNSKIMVATKMLIMITGSFADCLVDVDVIFLMKNAKHCIIPSYTMSSRRTEVL